MQCELCGRDAPDGCERAMCSFREEPRDVLTLADVTGGASMHTMDARDWARSFLAVLRENHPLIEMGFMTGWFANALMFGYDEGVRSLKGSRLNTHPASASERADLVEMAALVQDAVTAHRLEPQFIEFSAEGWARIIRAFEVALGRPITDLKGEYVESLWKGNAVHAPSKCGDFLGKQEW